ncbi:MAG: flagellar hook-basal body complex protein [Hyphomicrobiales bacterium]|nr:flagellar hook-basal body complex protein [Hyphomicrobiales bacterium]
MGIFGAMTTAITGLRAQAFALERISDNIANSQTTGYKRSDTSFADFVPDSPSRQQALGVVNAFSRPTNTIQGDIENTDVDTFMAINGDGYFIIADQVDTIDGQPVFGNEELYTRRGDFELDRSGFLVNSAGYFLKGLAIDPITGNTTGSLPEVIQITNDFLPGSATTRIDYRANLARFPLTASTNPDIPNSELIDPTAFTTDPTTAGSGLVNGTDADLFIDQSISGGAITAFDPGGAPVNVQLRWAKVSNTATAATTTGNAIANVGDLGTGIAGFNDGAAAVVTGGVVNPLDLGDGTLETFSLTIGANTFNYAIGDAGAGGIDELADLRDAINLNFGPGTATIVGGNQLRITAPNKTDSITVADVNAGAAIQAGLGTGTTPPTAAANDLFRLTVNSVNYDFRIGTDAGEVNTLTDLVNAINGTPTLNTLLTAGGTTALDLTADNNFTSFSIGGDTPVVNGLGMTAGATNPGSGGTDVWNLFYLADSQASGVQTAWQNVGEDYSFGSNGQLSPAVTTVALNNLTIDGVVIGNVVLDHGSNGITQFADANGTAKVTDISQDGFAAGELVGITVSEEGRVVGSYTNGRSIDLAEVTLASFNGDGGLAKTDGGAFRSTPESGAPILGSLGSVVGNALEGSNTDIADEFTKLIVTQQAYAAGTRIITTGDEMIQEALNMVR